MRWKQFRRTYLDDMWEEMGWDEMRRAEMRWEELIWFETRFSVECEVQVWSVRKVFAWRCVAPGSRAGHVLGQQHCNSFAQSTHARAWLVHGACNFYRWERSYSISLRQLPPRLARVLLVYEYLNISKYIYSTLSLSLSLSLPIQLNRSKSKYICHISQFVVRSLVCEQTPTMPKE